MESNEYKLISSYWQYKTDAYEIDIITIEIEERKANIIELKRNKKNFKPEILAEKTEHIKNKHISKYKIAHYCLSIEDM